MAPRELSFDNVAERHVLVVAHDILEMLGEDDVIHAAHADAQTGLAPAAQTLGRQPEKSPGISLRAHITEPRLEGPARSYSDTNHAAPTPTLPVVICLCRAGRSKP